eukprot:887792-Pyramimonas_sp.AAC.2
MRSIGWLLGVAGMLLDYYWMLPVGQRGVPPRGGSHSRLYAARAGAARPSGWDGRSGSRARPRPRAAVVPLPTPAALALHLPRRAR